MTPTLAGICIVLGLCLMLATGMPIAFALGLAAVAGLFLDMGPGVIYVLAETMFAGIANLGYVAIPMFVLMGAIVAGTPAGGDLYKALDRWLHKVPGGLVLSNIGACAIFSGMTGSSPATCAAIGKMGIPEMLGRGYPASVATGSIAAGGTLGILIPPSVTMIVYGISTQTSIGRLFLAGVLPGILLTCMFMAWALYDARRKGFRFGAGTLSYSWRDKLASLPKVLPLLLIILGMLFVLYGGVATPSEAAGAGALLTLVVVVLIYRLFRMKTYVDVFGSAMRESVMIMMIMASAELFAFALSSLFITQSLAAAIAALEINRWLLMGLINVFLLVAGKAEPQADGSHKISGTKIFISAGDHMAENIVHIVLARLPDAPAGTKGISLFIVPKLVPDGQGGLGARNAVSCGSRAQDGDSWQCHVRDEFRWRHGLSDRPGQ